MSRLRFLRSAERDLDEIWEFIARDDLSAANRLVDRIEEACSTLARMPRLGRPRPDITSKPLFLFPVEEYLIVYRTDANGMRIVRVVHGARNLPALFL